MTALTKIRCALLAGAFSLTNVYGAAVGSAAAHSQPDAGADPEALIDPYELPRWPPTIPCSAANAEPSGLLAGIARADITPPVGTPSMQIGGQMHVHSTGNDPIGMSATALVLRHEDDSFVRVSVDLVGVPQRLVDAMIEEASRQTGVDRSRIVISSTHTHAGISFPFSETYMGRTGPVGVDAAALIGEAQRYAQRVAPAVVSAIGEAAKNVQPAHMYGKVGKGSVAINRRYRGDESSGMVRKGIGPNPDGFVDHDLVVLRLDDRDGALVNYQAHPTVLWHSNTITSADYPGVVRKVIEDAYPTLTAQFVQGAAGNQGTKHQYESTLSAVERVGSILGHEATALIADIDTVRCRYRPNEYIESNALAVITIPAGSEARDQSMDFAQQVVSLPRRVRTPDEINGLSQSVDDARAEVELLRRTKLDSLDYYQAQAKLRRLSNLLNLWTSKSEDQPVMTISALRVGETAMVFWPVEMFSEIGARIKEQSPFPITMISGYSRVYNDRSDNAGGNSYVPNDEEVGLGGYEVDASVYGAGSEQLIVNTAVRLLERLEASRRR